MTGLSALREKLISAMYDKAFVLLDAITDPVAIEAAPLNQRVAPFSAVGKFLKHLETQQPAPEQPAEQPEPHQFTEIEWDFGPEYRAEQAEIAAQIAAGIDPFSKRGLDRLGSPEWHAQRVRELNERYRLHEEARAVAEAAAFRMAPTP